MAVNTGGGDMAEINNNLKEIEDQAAQVLYAIRCFVDALRSADQFMQLDCRLRKQLHGKSAAGTNYRDSINNDEMNGFSLMNHLHSTGAFGEVSKLRQDETELCHSSEHQSALSPTSSEYELIESHLSKSERHQILYLLVFPLMTYLYNCYVVLDNASDLPTASANRSASVTSKSNKRQNKPQPTIGMLSLNDYTNVACLLEFAVCTCLIPRMDHYSFWDLPSRQVLSRLIDEEEDGSRIINGRSLLSSSQSQMNKIGRQISSILAQKRSRFLPKALAGRIFPSIMVWGSIVSAKEHDQFCDDLFNLFKSGLTTLDQNSDQNACKCLQEQCLRARTHLLNQSRDELSCFASAMGQLLLLDRFRPMLLPRHLPDLYLSLVFLERCMLDFDQLTKNDALGVGSPTMTISNHSTLNRRALDRLYLSLQFASLKDPQKDESLTQKQKTVDELIIRPVDPREAAVAYRTLLSGEAGVVFNPSNDPNNTPTHNSNSTSTIAIPRWIRILLGRCLTKQAELNLHAIVDVFVVSASSPTGGGNGSERNIGNARSDEVGVMSGAAARLAKALCAKPSFGVISDGTEINFLKRVCAQFVEFLVDEGELLFEDMKQKYDEQARNASVGWNPSRYSLAMTHTLWATIGQLSLEVLQTYFGPALCSGLIPLDDQAFDDTDSRKLTSLQSTLAIWVWLISMPSLVDPSTTEKLRAIITNSVFQPNHTSNLPSVCSLSMLGQVFRLVVSFHQENRKSKLVVDVDSQNNAYFASQRVTEMALNLMVRSLLRDHHNTYPVVFELLKSITTTSYDSDGYCFCPQMSTSHADTNTHSPTRVYTQDKERFRTDDVTFLCRYLEMRAEVMVDVVLTPITSILHRNINDCSNSSSLNVMVNSLPSALFRLVLFIHYFAFVNTEEESSGRNRTLPAVIDDTIGHPRIRDFLEQNKGRGRMAATVLLGVVLEKCSPAAILSGSPHKTPNEADVDILDVLVIILDGIASCLCKETTSNESASDLPGLISTASITVSLVVSLLELGASKRSESSEHMLKSMLPSLRIMSSVTLQTRIRCQRGMALEHKGTLSLQLSELAEMSSHAIALISMRQCDSTVEDEALPTASKANEGMDSITGKLLLAERDLQSTQPPIRAKAVVSLRHIALYLSCDEVNPSGNEKIGAMITEVDEPSLPRQKEADSLRLIAHTLVRICLGSLSDCESYVYLAGIQTLVVVGDLSPSTVLPLTATLVATGTSNISAFTSTTDCDVSPVCLSLSSEQRIKAAEALIFMIRRRGKAIDLYGRFLLDLFMFGSTRCNEEGTASIQTSELYTILRDTHSYFSDGDIDDDAAERILRMNTGGPVFQLEENVILRAANISIVSELVCLLGSFILASYCHILVGLAIDALRLDSSRPVRRAAALLARELYARVESDFLDNAISNPSATSMAVAMVSSGENSLHSVLLRCVTANDVDTKGNVAVLGKTRLQDISTQTRCREAIDIRNHLESLSVFHAAAIIIHQSVNSEPVVKALHRAMSS